ncbi:uncharacterized protein LOC116950560 [Petromyzon marinus]|uniref:Uncharacterized protein LOC116950560 n=1 Tax=Petromyzon marinus TaxID=7757 RepID=A0AAJ7X7P0_PETMA|nr:uncharacterized protein LOC116950560 [Petromyzon marinus]
MTVRPCPDHCVSIMTTLSAQRLSGSSLCDLALIVHVPPAPPAAAASSGCGTTRRRRGAGRELGRGRASGAGGADGAGGGGEGTGGGAGELVVVMPCHRAVLAACSPLFRDAVVETHGDVEDGGGGGGDANDVGADRWERAWEDGEMVGNEETSAGSNGHAGSEGSGVDVALRTEEEEEEADARDQTSTEKDGLGAAIRNDGGGAAATEGATALEGGETMTTDAQTNVKEGGEEVTWKEGDAALKEEQAVLRIVEIVIGETALSCYQAAEEHSSEVTERSDPETAVAEEQEPVKDAEMATKIETPTIHPSSLGQWIPRLRPAVPGRWLCELPPMLGPLAVSRLLDFAYRGRLDAHAARDRLTLHAAQVLRMTGAIAAFMEPVNVGADRGGATPGEFNDTTNDDDDDDDGNGTRSSSAPARARGVPAPRHGRPQKRPRTIPVPYKDSSAAEDPWPANDVPAPAESKEDPPPARTLQASRRVPVLAEPKEDRAKLQRVSRKGPATAKPTDDSPDTPQVARKVPMPVESAEDLRKTPRASRKVSVLAEPKEDCPAKVAPPAAKQVPGSEDRKEESPLPAETPRPARKVPAPVDELEVPPAMTARTAWKVSVSGESQEVPRASEEISGEAQLVKRVCHDEISLALPGPTAPNVSLQNPQDLSDENDGATMNVAVATPDADGAAAFAFANGCGAAVDTDAALAAFSAASAAAEAHAAAADAGCRKRTTSRKKAVESAAAEGSKRSSGGQRPRRPRARTPGGEEPRQAEGESHQGEHEKRPKSDPGGVEETAWPPVASSPPGKAEQKRHQCTECSKSYASQRQLEMHTSLKHRNEGLCMCDMCGVTLGTRQGLHMHIKTQHKDERTFVCEFCGQRYGQRTGLMIHRRKHTGERPFSCSICGKDFMSRGTMAKHERTHTGERPVPCERCGRGFADRGSLVRHMQSVHSDGPLLSCTLCFKPFKSSDQLRAHLRRHTGQRKFNCSLCEYKFTRQAHLRRHMEVHGRVTDYCPQMRRLRTTAAGDQENAATADSSQQQQQQQLQLQLQQHLPPGTALTVPVAGQPSLLTYTITPSTLSASHSLALAVDLLNDVSGEGGEVAVEEVEEMGQEQHEHEQQLLQLQQQFQQHQQQQQQEDEEQQVADVATVAGGDDPGVALLLKLAEQNPGDVFVLMQS